MTNYIIAALLILGLLTGGAAYFEYKQNGKLQAANGTLQDSLDNVTKINQENADKIKELEANEAYQNKLIAAVDEQQLTMQNVKQTAITKVNNAKPSKCPAIPSAIVAAVGGMYDLRAAHGNANSSAAGNSRSGTVSITTGAATP